MRIFWVCICSLSVILGQAVPDPQARIAGCVDVITGMYGTSHEDMVSGRVYPLSVRRFYTQTPPGKKYTYCGWKWFEYVHAAITATAFGIGLDIYDRDGAHIVFRPEAGNEWSTKKAQRLRPPAIYFQNALCNTTCKHDPINDYVEMEKELKGFRLILGDGSVRYYKRVHKTKSGRHHYLLQWEKHPDKHKTRYFYHKDFIGKDPADLVRRYSHTYGLKRIESTNPQGTKVFSWLNFEYGGKKGPNFTVKGIDGRWVNYEFMALSKLDHKFFEKLNIPDVYVLTKVTGSDLPSETYTWKHANKSLDPTIAGYTLPKGHYTHIESNNQVQSLVQNGARYSFSYAPGITTVTDPEGGKTVYAYSTDRRLQRVEHYGYDKKPLTTVKFNWQNHRLARKTLFDSQMEMVQKTTYAYDLNGNCIQESHVGKHISQPLITERRFSQDRFNLLFEELSPSGLHTIYGYIEGSNLLAFKKSDTQQTFEYDEDFLLSETQTKSGQSIEITRYKRQNGLITEKQQAFRKSGKNSQEILGLNTAYVYDKKQQLICVKTGDHETHYTYDPRTRRLVSQTNPLGQTETFEYDKVGNITRHVNYAGHTTCTNYDKWNQATEIQTLTPDGLSRTTHFTYDRLQQCTSYTDYNGLTTQYRYDTYGRCIEESTPYYSSTTAYDAAGGVIQTCDRDGHTTYFTNNGFGKPISMVRADGTEINYTYDAAGHLKQETHLSGGLICYEYDHHSRLTKKSIIYDAETLSEEKWEYDAQHLLNYIDPENNQTSYEYDPAGNVALITKNFDKTQFEYDIYGRKIKTIHPNKHECFKYNALDQLIEESTEDPQGNLLCKIKLTYDAAGNRTSYVCDDHRENWVYDGFGRLTTHVDALGATSTFTYTDTQTIHTDPNGIKTIETFNAINQCITLQKYKDREIHREDYTYTPSGLCTKQLSTIYAPDGSTRHATTQWAYDSLGRQITLTEHGRTTTKSYNADSTLAILDKPGSTLTFSYDKLGHINQLISSDKTVDTTFTCDKLGRITTAHDNKRNLTTKRHYNWRNQLLQEQLGNGLLITSHYDNAGRRIRLIHNDGKYVDYTYNACHLRSITYGDYVHHFTKYSKSGHLLAQTSSNGLADASFTTNALGRRISIKHPYLSHTLDCLDSLGNVLSETQNDVITNYEYDDYSHLIQENTNNYTYDSHHNRLPIDTLTYDANGNLLYDGVNTYSYDALDRLTHVKTPTTTHEYTYDAFNRRIISSDNGTITFYYYDDQNEIGAATVEKTLIERRILAPSAHQETGASILLELDNTLYTPIHDLHGNIRYLLHPEEAHEQTFTAFGPTTLSSPWGFASKRHDSTGLIYFGNRFYHSNLGRFLTPDPLGPSEGPNPYQYALCNPFRYLDPTGLRTLNWTQPPELIKDNLSLIHYFHGSDSFHEPSWIPESALNPFYKATNYSLNRIEKPGIFIGFTNGICTDKKQAFSHAEYVSELGNGYNIRFTHNPTYGIGNDLKECADGLNGIITAPVIKIIERWEDAFKECGEHFEYLEIAHSQGAIHLKNALDFAPKHLRENITCVTIAGAAYISFQKCKDAYNYVSTRDFQKILEMKNKSGAGINLTVLKPHQDASWWDHDFCSSTYFPHIKVHGLIHIQKSGRASQ